MTSTLRVRAIQRKREGISAPLVWFPRLFHASTQKRSHWEILGTGQDIHWADVDEDLSVDGLLRGMRAPSPTEAQQPNKSESRLTLGILIPQH